MEYPPVHLLHTRINHKDMWCPKRHEIDDVFMGTWSNEHAEAGRTVRRGLLCEAC